MGCSVLVSHGPFLHNIFVVIILRPRLRDGQAQRVASNYPCGAACSRLAAPRMIPLYPPRHCNVTGLPRVLNGSIMSTVHLTQFQPLRGSDGDATSFAAVTMKRRLPSIVRRVKRVPGIPGTPAEAELEQLAVDLETDARLPDMPLPGDEVAAAAGGWDYMMSPGVEQTWCNAAWWPAENAMYRCILRSTRRVGVLDPFHAAKRELLEAALAADSSSWQGLDAGWPALLKQALLGNAGDLSLSGGDVAAAGRAVAGHLLADDREAAAKLLATPGPTKRAVTYVLDNCGGELLADLVCMAALLQAGWEVRVHLKCEPVFVSDVTEPDWDWTLSQLVAEGTPQVLRQARDSVCAAAAAGTLTLHKPAAWISGTCLWNCTELLAEWSASSACVIFKGDANYRRILGDRHVPVSTPFSQALSYMPVPLLAMRMLKAEVAAGIPASAAVGLPADWMYSGQFGVIQLAVPPAASSTPTASSPGVMHEPAATM